MDLDDVLIPRLAPTYAEEFQKLMDGKKKLAYIFYHKENYDAVTTRFGSKFSLKKMFGSLACKHKVNESNYQDVGVQMGKRHIIRLSSFKDEELFKISQIFV